MAIALSVAVLGVGATACGSSSSSASGGTGPEVPEGGIVGAGSVAQALAQEAWLQRVNATSPGAKIFYDPVGSDQGRRRFIDGDAAFAGSDAPLEGEELEKAVDRCQPGELVELPVYISPITIFANLKLTAMNLNGQTLAKIFNGEITQWTDPVIRKQNPTIGPIGFPPKLGIVPVGISGEPTMTEQVSGYFAKDAPGVWKYDVSGSWPVAGSKTASDAADVAELAGQEAGAISYTDFSHVGQLFGITRIVVGNEPVEPNVLSASTALKGAHLDNALRKGPKMLPVEMGPKLPAGGYPFVLVSYLIACTEYDSGRETTAVTNYVDYVASPEGQELTAESIGSGFPAPWLKKKIEAAIG